MSSGKLLLEYGRFCVRAIELNAFEIKTVSELIKIFFVVDNNYENEERT